MPKKEEVTVSLGEPAEVEVPAEIEEKAQQFIETYVDCLKDYTQAYKHRMAQAQVQAKVKPEAAPFLAGGYQYLNCLTVGPTQFYGDPPYRPSKIIKAGEETRMYGVVWINPVNSPGGGWPGTVTLGGRTCRARFETVNLSDVTNGPDWMEIRTFDNPAHGIYVFEWRHTWPNPGPNPKLYETTFTLDIVEGGQPMAAFSTWHYDIDTEPGFLWSPFMPAVPTTPAHYQFERPARFLVYLE
jgi:hypothetical protein